MNDEASVKIILDRYVTQYIDNFFSASQGLSVQRMRTMIKVADFSAELCRHDFAGVPKQPVADTNAIVRGIGELLPKLIVRSAQEQVVEMDNGPEVFATMRTTLRETGTMLQFQRSANAEQYGLTQCRAVAADVLEIRKMVVDEEASEHADRNALLDGEHADRANVRQRIDTLMEQTFQSRRVGGYAGSSQELAAYKDIGRQYLEFYISEYAEAEAFADSSIIGPITFAQWKCIAINVCALGFAKALLEDLDLFERRRFTVEGFSLMPPTRVSAEELRECFHVPETSGCQDLFDQIASCLILSEVNADTDYGASGAQPILVRVRDEVLMPRYARLGNPYMFLVTRLAQVYRHELRRIVSEREKKFQDDLTQRLAPGHYLFGTPNVLLYRADRTPLTDIDAVVYEKESNCLYLIQLKWFAMYEDFEERENQYEKLREKGTEWIDKVQRWIDRTPPVNVLKHVGLESAGIDPETLQIRLIMLNRGWTRFSGKEMFGTKAAWVSWSRLSWMLRGAQLRGSQLNEAWRQAMQTQALPHNPTGSRHENLLPGLTVIVYD